MFKKSTWYMSMNPLYEVQATAIVTELAKHQRLIPGDIYAKVRADGSYGVMVAIRSRLFVRRFVAAFAMGVCVAYAALYDLGMDPSTVGDWTWSHLKCYDSEEEMLE